MHKSKYFLFIGTIFIFSLLITAWINVQQSWIYFQKIENIKQLNVLQNQIFQDNKRLFVEINKLESPTSIMELIDKNPGWDLNYIKPSDIILIYPPSLETETDNAAF